ncbi:aldose 1-epimerase family protein [Clostridium estertheticum]|uniref:aldose 1-epimerase family protein n=1 Tax=Clostridium estertheticum TaxID=238834 RepID=UPI001C0DA398|nr:aldose 1-epimerase family protein [Clostridium estertheticum]MBU3172498.1 aldose 1-epimerase family protein [Clostridium estertheticum]
MNKIFLQRDMFSQNRYVIYKSEEFEVTLFKYSSGIEAIELTNSKGKVTILPFMGQIIWGLEFDGHDLRMKNMFKRPRQAKEIVETYGCFAFHSGLLANGCPSPEDTHLLHGEMACSKMDNAWLEIDNEFVKIEGDTEYAKGFGDHYLAKPSVTLSKGQSNICIEMSVTNLSECQDMPLQYMCHMNYVYVDNAKLTQTLPNEAFMLRESIPAHVHPTKGWLAYNNELKEHPGSLNILNGSEMYDPEIVFFADKLEKYGEYLTFEMASPEGFTFFTKFSTKDFNYATRWLLYNEDQKVAAFVLPGTCRPEGFNAAKENGSLIYLKPQEVRTFKVITGKK